MQTVYLSLGSNLGQRQNYLQDAVHLLGQHQQILIEKQSQFYETSPVGGVVQDDFINLALRISTTLTAEDLLAVIHEIEQKLNRVREIHWGPRTIDIDILFFGNQEQTDENLTLPHKEVFHRLFVLVPLLELIDENFAYFSKIKSAIESLQDSAQKIVPVKAELPARVRIERAVTEILKSVGEDPQREGLLETPARVAKMYEEILSSQSLAQFDEFKIFQIAPSQTDQMVLIKDIPFYSMCEHHMLPFFGVVHVAYLPKDGKIIGLSKIPRLVNFVSRRLSVQENITRDIAETLNQILTPKGVAVVVEARHMCVEMRGVKKINSTTRTSYYLGAYEDDFQKREEFLESLQTK